MNLCDFVPLLSRTDRQQVINELKSKNTETLINLILTLYEETQRLNKLIVPKADKSVLQQNEEQYQELSRKYNNLMVDYQNLFSVYQKSFQNHVQVINAQNSFIANLKQQAEEQQQVLLVHSEQLIRFQGDLNVEINPDEEFQKQIDELNKASKIIQQERSNALSFLEQVYNKNNKYERKITQQNIEEIIVYIKQFQNKTQIYLESSQNFLANLSQDKQQEIYRQVIHNQKILQYNIVVFKKLEIILPAFVKEFKEFEDQADRYKIQLEKEQKLKNEYFQKAEEYKRQFEGKCDQQRNYLNINTQKLLEICYKIQAQFFFLTIILIEKQHLQDSPDLRAVLQRQNQNINQFENSSQLLEYTKKLKTEILNMANYIKQNNNIQDILGSVDEFYKGYLQLIKQLFV